MTAQISDVFEYQQRCLSIAGISEGSLFEPEAFGLDLGSNCSACWRGYQAVFALSDNRLVLDKLHVWLNDPQHPPTIHGVAGESPGKVGIFNWRYDPLRCPLNYTGGVLLATGFISELYVHMGFHPAWKFREVHELIFKAGELIEASDRSEKMAEIREQIIASQKQRRATFQPDAGQIPDFVARAFDQRYRL